MARRRSIGKKIVRILLLVPVIAFAYLGYIYLTLPDVRPLATEAQSDNDGVHGAAGARGEARRAARGRVAIRQQWVPYERHLAER